MKNIAVTICEDSQQLNPTELGDFLYLFRATNIALSKLLPLGEQKEVPSETPEEVDKYREQLGKFSPKELDSFFDPHTEPELLQIQEITRQSPLELVYIGCPCLIVLAVVFSGGKVSFEVAGSAIKAEINSLGHGIKSLKKALGLGKRLNAGYGIRGTVVKLTREEYKTLMLQPPESKGKGGFQNFIVGLQGRVKRNTLELELSESDLERIYRWKANPKKGGWQSRFKKIFGRIFNDEQGEL